MTTVTAEQLVLDKQNVLQTFVKHRERLKGLGVKRLGVFGSFVRGEQRADSDVDLLVEFEPEQKTFEHFMELSFFLEDLFGRRVELLTLESLSPYIGPHILKEVEYVSLDERAAMNSPRYNVTPCERG